MYFTFRRNLALAKSKPNMRDVAEAAEVSASTVWMVIHNKPGVSPETSQKVWDIIGDLGYMVKTNSEKKKTTDTLGLLIEQNTIPAISDVFYGDIIRGFQAEADELGYQVILSMFDRSQQSLGNIRSTLIPQISGLVIANDGDITPEIIKDLQSPGLPIVLVESHIEDHQLTCVLGDNFMAGYKITRHILDLGHRDIAILKGPTKYSSLVDRLRGCLAAIAENGLTVRHEWMPEPIKGHPLKGYMQMQDILGSSQLPTAVIAISDKTALGAMEAIREADLHIPNDISIGSIDNTHESGYARPPLTTVHIPKFEIGVLALRNLHDIIEGRNAIPLKSIVYSELIIRESTGKRHD
ncbi:MAG: LacI family DNA-binding transcriptional regulator [Candidatus Marinimicrobia bacterium]|jgi:DNA-binding LacI/PurR family transcriptional regulator|nr:LacI family DNA-binding transcriptional regulator [Candidatus Neomarinimicrobiota bacterium]